MYVCLCKGVTDRQIRRAIDEGARSYRAVRECLGVATQCGKCGCSARAIVREELAGRQGHQPTPIHVCVPLAAVG